MMVRERETERSMHRFGQLVTQLKLIITQLRLKSHLHKLLNTCIHYRGMKKGKTY